MNPRFEGCSRAEVAGRIYNQLHYACSRAGIPPCSYEQVWGQGGPSSGLRITHICIRFIPARADAEDERQIIPFDSSDDFIQFFPGEGWELLEVFAYMIATTYPIGGLMSVGIGYTSKTTDECEDELWLGFNPPL